MSNTTMELKDYLQYYIGCECTDSYSNENAMICGYNFEKEEPVIITCNSVTQHRKLSEIKPILRRLSDIKYAEAFDFALMCMTSKHHLSVEDQIKEDEMSNIELAKNDGGYLLDDDVAVYIGVSVRCFEGAVILRKDGSITVQADGEDHDQRIDDIADKVIWLLSKHFDLFGLIDAGLAIDKATLNQ